MAFAALALAVVGCGAVTQRVTPVKGVEEKRICVMTNPSARETFLTAYQKALEQKGFTVIIVPERASPTGCPLISTYNARWTFRAVTTVLVYAEIDVLKGGTLAGSAVYRGRGRSTEAFVNAESKIVELVDQLFPGL